MTQLSFNVSPHDRLVIEKIAARAVAMDISINGRNRLTRKPVDWEMDITATHASGNPLRLEAMLEADDFNFAHDIFGIARKLDRETGQLTDFFSPRFTNQPLRRELAGEEA